MDAALGMRRPRRRWPADEVEIALLLELVDRRVEGLDQPRVTRPRVVHDRRIPRDVIADRLAREVLGRRRRIVYGYERRINAIAASDVHANAGPIAGTGPSRNARR